MGMSRGLIGGALAVVTAICLVFFQSCQKSIKFSSPDKVEKSSELGNGDGYTGLRNYLVGAYSPQLYNQLTFGFNYYRFLEGYQCGAAGNAQPSHAGRMFNQNMENMLVTDDCDMASEVITGIENSAYNPEYAGYQNGIYQRFDGFPTASSQVLFNMALCRTSADPGTGIDIIIKKNSLNSTFQAQLISGKVVNSEFFKYETGVFDVQHSSGAFTRYSSSQFNFTLNIDNTSSDPYTYGGFLSTVVDSEIVQSSVACRKNEIPPGVQPAITATDNTLFVLSADGNVRSWGRNNSGQLGRNSVEEFSFQLEPVQLQDGSPFTGGEMIHGASSDTCIIHESGEVYCLGRNQQAEVLGNSEQPAVVPYAANLSGVGGVGNMSGVRKVTGISGAMGYVVTNDDQVISWGLNQFSGGTVNRSATSQYANSNRLPAPAYADLLNEPIADIAGGMFHVCVVLKNRNNAISCWGRDNLGQLATGQLGNQQGIDLNRLITHAGTNTPVRSIGIIYSEQNSLCTITDDRRGVCWGRNNEGRLGTEDMSDNVTGASYIRGLNNQGHLDQIKEIDMGRNFGCALRTNGDVVCWGFNDVGQLGRGTMDNNTYTPARVAGLDNANIIDIATTLYGACALDADGTIYCWGNNNWGALGPGTVRNQHSPVPRIVQQ